RRGRMNRRAFLTAISAVATQQKFSRVGFRYDIDSSEPVPVTVSRFPYIQNLQDDRVSILWATFEAGVGQVRYSSDGVNFRYATATPRFFNRIDTGLLANFTQYQADLTELSANTDYVYAVSVNGQDIGAAGETRFRTAGSGPFKFIVLGDSGWGD